MHIMTLQLKPVHVEPSRPFKIEKKKNLNRVSFIVFMVIIGGACSDRRELFHSAAAFVLVGLIKEKHALSVCFFYNL
jgi:hypothetical protein